MFIMMLRACFVLFLKEFKPVYKLIARSLNSNLYIKPNHSIQKF